MTNFINSKNNTINTLVGCLTVYENSSVLTKFHFLDKWTCTHKADLKNVLKFRSTYSIYVPIKHFEVGQTISNILSFSLLTLEYDVGIVFYQKKTEPV